MRIAVVTPFYRVREDWLAQCHASVRAQTHACTHFLVSDGSGSQPLADFEGQFIELQHNHADYGDTPRAIGSLSAAAQGYDAVIYLDADDWILSQHVQTLVTLQQESGAAVCTAARNLHDLDGQLLGPCQEDNGVDFAGTGSLMIARSGYALLGTWALMPREFHIVGDRWLWSRIRRHRIKTARSDMATTAYRTGWPHHYTRFGREPPPGAKPWDIGRRVDEAALTLNAWLQREAASG